MLLSAGALVEAQTIRFQTSVGDFDMVLNPTGNANLQSLVDNMIANVTAGVYHESVINRAVEGFVLQMGGFRTDTVVVDRIPFEGFDPVDSFSPVILDRNNDRRVDFSTTGLTNVRGTVSLALSSGPNTGSSSFFINQDDNSFLDSQGFVPFAEISDMTVIERIQNGPKVDISDRIFTQNSAGDFVAQSGNLTFIDVPLDDHGNLIIIESAAVIDAQAAFTGPLLTAFGVDSLATASASGSSTSSSLSPGDIASMFPPLSVSSTGLSVPEPASALLLSLALAGVARRR
ncbi:peptidylprolyl isomerase [Botrimarina hoheduenensis]|nr:peptidylprolyl isomerase [Botrimarina hoheduenensis]